MSNRNRRLGKQCSIRAPFPYFGGKSRVAHLVWERFGNPVNYVEPFAGSLAVLLGRPTVPRTETVNDLDCYLANFWRALQADPEAVADWADWPVNEADLSARHQWLVDREDFRERMKTDPDYYDAKIAGWWVWGISQWIGGEWCKERATGWHRRPSLSTGCGVHRKRPSLGGGGRGIHRKLPQISTGGRGVHRQKPCIAGPGGRGIHRQDRRDWLQEYMEALANRLRYVRVCCGDWTRIISPTATHAHGVTAIFLDPPYSNQRDTTIYAQEDLEVYASVGAWARESGDNPLLRIALCGLDGEHDMPATWTCVPWKTGGGYSNRSGGRSKNADRERIWFSPHCLGPPTQGRLFDTFTAKKG